jgi:dTDP-4-dehydrorhamnose reductase
MSRTAIIGASGTIGNALLGACRNRYPDTIGTAFRQIRDDLITFELGKQHPKDLPLNQPDYDSIVIAAGITNIGYINTNPMETSKINVSATLELAEEMLCRGLHVIFLSSDNVFRGDSGGYHDKSETNPVSEYGIQKKQVEEALKKIDGKRTVIRLTKAVGLIRGDGTVIDDIISQITKSEVVKAASDLVFNPTFVGDIVNGILKLKEEKIYGTVNFANPEIWNRYQLTLRLAELMYVNSTKIREILFSDLNIAGGRPLNTTVKNSKCFANMSFKSVEDCMQEIMAQW